MSAHADEIRDAEIAELQRRVKDLERRVWELEQRPVYVPVPFSPPHMPDCPYRPAQPAMPWVCPPSAWSWKGY